MQSFFTRRPDATWTQQKRLHVYLLPHDDAVAAVAAAYQNRLDERLVSGRLSRIPRRWLHMSVEKLNVHLDDLREAERAALIENLRAQLATVPEFVLQIGPHLVSAHALELDAWPDEPWHRLRQAVRDGATAALGKDAIAPMSGLGRPHITLGYATGEIDLESHFGALNHVRGRASTTVDTAHLVAVDQHPDRGLYTWDLIDVMPLATG